MRFAKVTQANTYTNDPKGFETPYRICGKMDEERLKWKYFRLSNFPSRPNKIRCNDFVFGNCERRRVYVKF
jgi:hypothetical protein